jgi:hypothetical protein
LKNWILYILLLYIYTSLSGNVQAQNIQLRIQGKDSTENQILKNLNYKTSFPDYLSLSDEVYTTLSFLTKKGYVHSELLSLQKDTDSSYVAQVSLHNKFEKIRILNPDIIFPRGIQKKDLYGWGIWNEKNQLEIPFEHTEEILQAINVLITETGDPFATLQLIEIHPDPEENEILNAQFNITYTEKRTITDLVVKGYEKFPKSFLRYTFGIKEGMVFQYQKIVEKNQLIEQLPFVTSMKDPEVLFKEDETVVYFYLNKKPANTFDGILGFSTDDSTGRLILNGYISLMLLNNLNFGERLSLEYRNDGHLQETFDVKVELPYLFKTPFGVEAGLNLFKQDSSYVTVKNQLLLNYKINHRTQLFGGYKTQRSENLLKDENLNSNLTDYAIKAGVLGAHYEVMQPHAMFPIKTRISLTGELGKKKVFQNKTPHFRGESTITHIFNLNQTSSFVTENISSIMLSENTTENELIRLGGIKSIRGFDENSLSATFYSVLRTEYRYMITPQSYVHTLADAAFLQSDITHTNHQLYSFGIGLGQLTRAGLLQLSIANGKMDNQNFKFSNTKIHVSLRAVF